MHSCCVKVVKVGATFNGGHFVGRVCAQCSLHPLMKVGVDIGSGRCKGGSGGIIFMEANPQSGLCTSHIFAYCCCFSCSLSLQFSHVIVVVVIAFDHRPLIVAPNCRPCRS